MFNFNRFPKDPEVRLKWVSAARRCNKDGSPFKFGENSRLFLCSNHFLEKDFNRTGQITRLHEGVIPSIFEFPRRVTINFITRKT